MSVATLLWSGRWAAAGLLPRLAACVPPRAPPPAGAAAAAAAVACRAGRGSRSIGRTEALFASEPPFTPPPDDEDAAAAAPPPPPAAAARRRRRRLDEVVAELHPELSRNVVQSFIAQGKVLVDDQPVLKAGAPVKDSAAVVLTAAQPRYVCRGGLKLEAALDAFSVDPAGRRCLDAGLSTGGFADCLLQRGAAHVVGVDVGYGQVAERVRVDARVTVLERTNLRHLRLVDLPDPRPLDLVTLDLSFISVLKVREAVGSLLAPGGDLLVLVKPQFEAGRAQVGAGGVVRDPAVHAEVRARVAAGWAEAGFACAGWADSPIRGAAAGNAEFLAHFRRAAG